VRNCVCAKMCMLIESFVMGQERNDWKLVAMIDDPTKWYLVVVNFELLE